MWSLAEAGRISRIEDTIDKIGDKVQTVLIKVETQTVQKTETHEAIHEELQQFKLILTGKGGTNGVAGDVKELKRDMSLIKEELKMVKAARREVRLNFWFPLFASLGTAVVTSLITVAFAHAGWI